MFQNGQYRRAVFPCLEIVSCDENSDTIDSYVTYVRQVATLLGYGKPPVLDVLEKHLPSRLYGVLLPIEDHRQATETAERFLTKEN